MISPLVVSAWLTRALLTVGGLLAARLLFVSLTSESPPPYARLSEVERSCPICGHTVPVRRGRLAEHGTLHLSTGARTPCAGSRSEAP